jgi:hypothetical protein
MKLICLFIFIPLICSASLPDGDFLGTRSSRFERADYDFSLTKTALLKAPKWDTESEFPPLSPKQAHAIAFAQLKKIIPEQYQWMRIYTVSLESLYDSDWVYLITYEYTPPTAYSGPMRLFTIPVYLDGTIITPLIRKEKK